MIGEPPVKERAKPRATDGARKRDRSADDNLPGQKTRKCVGHQRERQYRHIVELHDASALLFAPAPDVGPYNRQHTRQSGEATENSAAKSDNAVGCRAAP